MAQADGVVANGTGAAVRADINDQLAAVFTNHSGSSEPATTYAYQWWADTNENVLKIRNSSNDGWITLRELDGTMLIEDGSASTPGLAFADDVNTGIFSPAADQIGFATGGAERLEIGSSEVVFNDPSNDVDFRVESNGNTHMLFVDGGNNRVGIGKSSPRSAFELGIGHIVLPASGRIGTGGSGDTPETAFRFTSADNISAIVGNNEKFRIDNDGRLLVGVSSSRSVSSLSPSLQVEGTGGDSSTISATRNVNSAAPPRVCLAKSRGTSVGSSIVVQSGDSLGEISFSGADGTDANSVAATILCQVDGTPGSNDMPGRIMFNTTADGASSPTERARITSEGKLLVGTTSVYSPSGDGQVPCVIQDAGDHRTALVVNNQTNGSSAGSAVVLAAHGQDWQLEATSLNKGNRDFTIKAGANERLRLDNSGRFLYGTTTAQNLNNASGASAREAKAYIFNTASTTSERYNLGLIGGAANTAGPTVFLSKTRATTNSHTVVQSGDELGDIRFAGSDGTFFVEAAKIRAKVDGTPGSQDMPGRLEFLTTEDGDSSATERMRLGSDGKLLIGSDTGSVLDDRLLQVGKTNRGSTYVSITSSTSGVGGLLFADTTTNDTGGYRGQVAYRHNTDALQLWTAATERLSISDVGKFTASTIYSLTTTGGGPVYVEADGDLLRYTSSLKYKTDVETIEDARADAILNCRPVWYRSKCANDIKTEGSEKSDWGWYGFIAEEVAEIEPRLVNWATKDGVKQEDGSMRSVERDPADYEAEGVRYDNFVPLLVNLVKRQQAAIETLEAKVAALEAG